MKVIELNNHWVWDIKTKVCVFSDSWCKNLGYEPDEIAHHEDTWKSFVHKDCMPRVREKLQPVLSGEIDFYKCKYRLRNKENKYIWHLDTGRVTKRDDNGRAALMEGQDVRVAS